MCHQASQSATALEVAIKVLLHRVFERVLAEVPTRTIRRVHDSVLGLRSMDVRCAHRWIRSTLEPVV
jgi:hypothetical protein